MKIDNKVSYIDKQGQVRNLERSNKEQKKSTFDSGKYLNIGFYLATPLLLGVFLGIKLDEYLHTKPLFIVSLIVLGAVASFYNLIKLTQDASH